MVSCSMLSFSACRVFWFRFSCSHFICFMFRVTFHIFTSHVFIFQCSCCMFSVVMIQFSFFIYRVFIFMFSISWKSHLGQQNDLRELQNHPNMTSRSSKMARNWAPKRRGGIAHLWESRFQALPGARSLFLTTLCSVLNDPRVLFSPHSPRPPAPVLLLYSSIFTTILYYQ